MQARYASGSDLQTVLDPESRIWRTARPERIPLAGTPVGMQPSAAIRAAWTGRPTGSVERVEVRALHDGELLAFRLEWPDAHQDLKSADIPQFPDAAAVVLPATPGAPIVTMGAPGAPVNAWYWRADEEGTGRHVVAEGLGTSRTLDRELVRTRGSWKDGRWRVVIARALRVRGEAGVAQLSPGKSTGFGVAVWEGRQAERAGLKAFSGDWRNLALAPVPPTGS